MRFRFSWLLGVLLPLAASAQMRVPVVVAGVSHGHAAWVFEHHKQGRDIRIVAVQDADRALALDWARRYGIAETAVYTDLATAVRNTQPGGILAYGALDEHLPAMRVAAQFRVPLMVEKPLAHTLADAREMARLSRESGTPVLVNYESSWYPALTAALALARDSIGTVRKILVNAGHNGPVELGAGPEFLAWLTESARGGGALVDFGCYGANIATAVMGNAEPLSVTAVTARNKPNVYPRCEDEASIVVQYPGAQAVIQGSWNWPFGRKDAAVYGTGGFVAQTGATEGSVRTLGQAAAQALALPAKPPYSDAFAFFADFVRNGHARRAQPYLELAGLANNLRVMEILEAARISAREGRRVPFAEVRTR